MDNNSTSSSALLNAIKPPVDLFDVLHQIPNTNGSSSRLVQVLGPSCSGKTRFLSNLVNQQGDDVNRLTIIYDLDRRFPTHSNTNTTTTVDILRPPPACCRSSSNNLIQWVVGRLTTLKDRLTNDPSYYNLYFDKIIVDGFPFVTIQPPSSLWAPHQLILHPDHDDTLLFDDLLQSINNLLIYFPGLHIYLSSTCCLPWSMVGHTLLWSNTTQIPAPLTILLEPKPPAVKGPVHHMTSLLSHLHLNPIITTTTTTASSSIQAIYITPSKNRKVKVTYLTI